MISTPEEYEATQEWIATFERDLKRLSEKNDDEDPRVHKIRIDACASFLESLRREAAEYEAANQPELAGAGQR